MAHPIVVPVALFKTMNMKKPGYGFTVSACSVAYFLQAAVVNVTPILFIPLREQFNCVVSCKNYFRLLQINSYMRQEDITSTDDMKLEGATYKKSIFFHSPADYGRYDTYYKIEKNNFVSEEGKVTEIYDRYTLNRGE